MPKEIHILTLKDFARIFGTTVVDIPKDCRVLIAKTNWQYRKPASAERDQIILQILKKIESGAFSIAGKQKIGVWEKGWGDILRRFKKSKYDIATLFPHYDLKPGEVLRLNQDFVVPQDPMFEMKWLEIFRIWFFKKYLKDASAIYEFGCGTGQNLVLLAKLFPEKKLYGLEWVQPSVDILNLLAKKQSLNIEGHLFDMFNPDKSLRLSENSVVFTRAALEQMGTGHDKFLDFLLKQQPALCVHSEPVLELYDGSNLVDHLAVSYHKKRNYLDGFLSRLRELEGQGRIEIVAVHRVSFGSIYLDPYSYVVWRPKKNQKSKIKSQK